MQPLNRLPLHGLIVSCQAPVSSPLHDPSAIAAMAKAALNQGATAVRIDTPAHIQAVREQTDAPIIGLWKRQFPDSEVYITPQFSQAVELAQAGADWIAIDATNRPRPGNETLHTLIAQIHQQLNKPVFADVDTLESANVAFDAGADLLATTLYGYTSETRHLTPPGYDLLEQLVQNFSCPMVCEGGISSPEMAQKALDLGAIAVVVGTDITGIDQKVKSYQQILSTAKSVRYAE
ncbi:N-acetylmannosamine-6-phosphate 2-epimerase [Roseofilum reptotaenium CS-1145]|uniref:Putative N-acetylmannosamine-6-phosphate 2-epimerase n=1 Tax=Roseofilum reptotaenium AO1-A TaxID=1925591 RepID=A0A1L9QWM4_9CYAN|nr:N-acetylmannosamine-6-phosphate 2-epimerase [Roseofilum reptotaenium]MDB9518562.1 N-acetylmannosamine-6-phosphate 2-epimerase [Roseofilum reptotaenium CS-1145]OJJ27039.1 acetylmannosamine-6-phosphate 2-epimerase [Roseofilum reptotaenium AO1-A]